MSESTLISREELSKKVAAEGIDPKKVLVMAPRWAESAPKKEGVRSALVRCDLIVRSDRSVVYLDGAMAIDSVLLATAHLNGGTNLEDLDWDEYVKKMTLRSRSK